MNANKYSTTMEKLSRILHDLDQGNINVELAKHQVLDLFVVSGSFSAEKLKEAYTDGFSDSRYDFDSENYR